MTTAEIVEERKATSLTGWKKAAQHYVTCPSGVTVGIRIPDLPRLIEAGEIPQHLLDAALEAAANDAAGTEEAPTKEKIAQQREFTDKLVQLTVVEPKLSDADVAEVPFEDKDFIVAVAMRARDLDAEGNHIAGLDKSEKFRRFRGLGEFRPNVEGL